MSWIRTMWTAALGLLLAMGCEQLGAGADDLDTDPVAKAPEEVSQAEEEVATPEPAPSVEEALAEEEAPAEDESPAEEEALAEAAGDAPDVAADPCAAYEACCRAVAEQPWGARWEQSCAQIDIFRGAAGSEAVCTQAFEAMKQGLADQEGLPAECS